MREPLNILIIEDLEEDAKLILRELRRDGFELTWQRVQTADTLHAALMNYVWDVIISDYRLPGFDAPRALALVKRVQPDLPFIVVSGTIGETSAVEMMKAGAHDYLMKDNLARLSEAVRREVRDAKIRAEHKLAALELDRIKERLQLAIEGSGIGLWDWSIESGSLTLNERWASIMGYTLLELAPITIETWRSNTHPQDLQKAALLLEQHFRHETQVYECELRMRHKRGTWIWVLARGKVVEWDEAGNALRMIGTHLDITDRKHFEATLQQLNHVLEHRVQQRTAALQHSEARLREAQQVARLGSWELDVLTRDITWSAEIFNIFGLDPTSSEPSYEQLLRYFPPHEQVRFKQFIDRAIQYGESYTTDLQIVRADGSPGYIFTKAEISRNDVGEVTRLFGIVMDISDRKAMQEALQLSEERARATLLALPDLVFRVNRQGQYVDFMISPQGQNLLDPQLVVGKSIYEALPSDLGISHAETKYAALQRALATQTVQSYEQQVSIDGILRYEEVRVAPCGHDEAVFFVRDISDRKQAEAKLQQQADREHLVSAISQRIRASLNLDDILNTTVEEVQQVLQVDRVLIYRFFPDLTGVVTAESVADEYPAILNSTFPQNIFPLEIHQLYLQGRIIALSDRETESIFFCFTDFLKNIQVRAKLVAPIIEHNNLWGLLVAHQCEMPRQWQTWEIELLQQLSSHLAIAIQQSELYAQLQESHQQLTNANAELSRATRLKDEFLANMSHELRTPLNAILGMAEGLQDMVFGPINERQSQSIATIERSGRHLLELINDILEVSKIAAGKLELSIDSVSISHLCNSSLAMVKQQAFQKQIQLYSNLAGDLGEICVDERRMRQVLINLLSNAVKFTPMGGQVTLNVSWQRLQSESQDGDRGEEAAGNNTQASTLEYSASDRRHVSVDTLPQPGANMDDQPLQPRTANAWILFSVIDTGIGIAEADQNKLFQPFVQIDSSLNRRYEGTGLGLMLVKQIVELHGGSVSMMSELGRGSCFTVRLPHDYDAASTHLPSSSLIPNETALLPSFDAIMAQPQTATPLPTAIAQQPLILLAEDNDANINTISSYLTAKGYRILVAKDGQEAVELTQTHHPDLILMDIQMPKFNGLEAIEQIRRDRQFSNTPIIAVTALAMAGDRERCLTAGANEYVGKPVKLKHLTEMIQTFIKSKDANA